MLVKCETSSKFVFTHNKFVHVFICAAVGHNGKKKRMVFEICRTSRQKTRIPKNCWICLLNVKKDTSIYSQKHMSLYVFTCVAMTIRNENI